MALPVAAVVSKGVAIVKGVSAAKLARAGVTVVSSASLANSMTKKEKKQVEKNSRKNGLGINFDISGKFKINNNCNRSKRYKRTKYKQGGKR